MQTKMKVLYGDDKLENREALARELRARGLDVDLAASAEEMLAKAKANNYHAYLTDLEYSADGREGFDVLRQLKSYSGLKVLYTGSSEFGHELEALERGADYAVMRKNQSALLELLDKELKLGGQNGR